MCLSYLVQVSIFPQLPIAASHDEASTLLESALYFCIKDERENGYFQSCIPAAFLFLKVYDVLDSDSTPRWAEIGSQHEESGSMRIGSAMTADHLIGANE